MGTENNQVPRSFLMRISEWSLNGVELDDLEKQVGKLTIIDD